MANHNLGAAVYDEMRRQLVVLGLQHPLIFRVQRESLTLKYGAPKPVSLGQETFVATSNFR
jgi:hypothetical protein